MKNILKEELITYGIHYDPKLFCRIKNRKGMINKPSGGLWSSPVNSEWGWKNWCECNDFRLGSLGTWTKFKLCPNAKILVIDSFKDFENTLNKYHKVDPKLSTLFGAYYLDFEQMILDGYDGLFLTEKGNYECHLPDDFVKVVDETDGTVHEVDSDLNSWDCESLLIFNKDIINITEIY